MIGEKGRYWKDGRMIGEEGETLERWEDDWRRREDTGKMGGCLGKNRRY